MPNANFNDLLSTTLNNHLPKLIDNVFSARPLAYFLQQADQIRKVGGGAKIVIPLIHDITRTTANAELTRSYAGDETLLMPVNAGVTAAEYNWKQAAVSVSIQGVEEDKNDGEEEVLDLLEARIMQAEESFTEWLDRVLIVGDGTGNSGKDPNGLANLVAQNATAVGGISPATDTFWQSKINTTAEALSIGRIASQYNNPSVGNDQPTFALTTQALYEKYESLLQPQLRFADSKTADAGFQNLLYKGAPVVYDTYVPTGYWYFLNTKYLRIVAHKNKWFKSTPFVRPYNVDARYAQILSTFEFTISNRARQSVMTAKT